MNNNHELFDPKKVLDHAEFKVLSTEEAKQLDTGVNIACAYNEKQSVPPPLLFVAQLTLCS